MSSERSDLLRGSKVLVTGGSGFIGCNLCQELAEGGKHVIILHDLSSSKEEDIRELLEDGLEFARRSITDLPLLQIPRF